MNTEKIWTSCNSAIVSEARIYPMKLIRTAITAWYFQVPISFEVLIYK